MAEVVFVIAFDFFGGRGAGVTVGIAVLAVIVILMVFRESFRQKFIE